MGIFSPSILTIRCSYRIEIRLEGRLLHEYYEIWEFHRILDSFSTCESALNLTETSIVVYRNATGLTEVQKISRRYTSWLLLTPWFTITKILTVFDDGWRKEGSWIFWNSKFLCHLQNCFTMDTLEFRWTHFLNLAVSGRINNAFPSFSWTVVFVSKTIILEQF